MTTVAQINAKAMNAVAAKLTDVVLPVTVMRRTGAAYNPATGVRAIVTSTENGRAVVDMEKPVSDIFGDFTRGPADRLVWFEGITSLLENDLVTMNGRNWTVVQALAIMEGTGGFYGVLR